MEITKRLANEYECKPRAMLIAYCSPDGNATYVETRAIKDDGTPGAAKPVTMGFMNALLTTFSKEFVSTPSGRMPSRLLYADTRSGQEKYIWYSLPGRHPQTFLPDLGLEDGDYLFPGCVFMLQGEDLYAFAYRGKVPTEKTQLLKGPFYNYYASGRMCLGDAKASLPSPLTWDAFLDAWESLFWNSKNSHMMSGHNPVKGNLGLVLKSQREQERFDTQLLEKTIYTVNDLFNQNFSR